jgi:hypothetical protein
MKEQQSAGALWESNPTAYAVSPAKYHPPTASFIMLIKKGEKQQVCVTELLVKLITGWI